MKSMKYLVITSAILLALAGCDKKERPVQPKETTKEEVKTAEPVVEERPKLACDDDTLKNRVMSLVNDNILKSAVGSLAEAENVNLLEEVFKAKLSTLAIGIDDVKEQGAECVAKVHMTLSESDVEYANKAFAKADLPTLAEQATELGLELVDGRLVGDLIYQVDGDALSIKATDNPAIDLVSAGLAKAIALQVEQQQKTTKPAPKPTNPVKVTPITTPTVRPATPTNTTPTQSREPSRTNNNSTGANANTGNSNAQVTPPKPRVVEQPAQPVVSTRPVPKPEPKVEPKPEPKPTPNPVPKVEPKAEPSVSHKPVTDNSAEITIVESDDTY